MYDVRKIEFYGKMSKRNKLREEATLDIGQLFKMLEKSSQLYLLV